MVFNDAEAAEFINNHFISLKIDRENKENKQLREKYNVRGNPTVVFLNSDSEEVDRICGFNGDKDKYLQTIKDYVDGKNTLNDLFTKYTSDTLNVESNFLLANKLDSRWESEKAHKHFVKVLELDPENEAGFIADAKFQVVNYQAWHDKNVEPLKEFLDVCKKDELVERGYNTLVDYFRNEKDTVSFFITYEKGLSRLPESTNLMNGYAWAIHKTKMAEKYDIGIHYAEKAVELKPDADSIWDTLAWLYFDKGEVEKAIKAMEKALEIQPDTEYYMNNLKIFKEAQ